jgi:hypothetical protein
LKEILKFGLSVLGLTWENIRGKLVAATNETTVKAFETGFELVKTLVTQGPAAAWQQLLESLSNLKSMVMDAIMDFIKGEVVKIAIEKVVMMLNPAGAFIQALLAIYRTVMFIVNKLSQIARVVAALIDGIAAIASGNIGPAAGKVETVLAGGLSLAISFLASFAGLGNVSKKVVEIVQKIRAPVNKAMDKVVGWIVAQAKKLGKMVKDGVDAVIDWWKAKFAFRNKGGEAHTLQFIGTGPTAKLGIATELMPIRQYLDARTDKETTEWKNADKAYREAETIIFSTAKKTEKEKDDRRKVGDAMAKMGAAFAQLSSEPPTAKDYKPTSAIKYGPNAEIEFIYKTPPSGGSATGAWPTSAAKGGQHWVDILSAGLTTAGDKWVQMHIITAQLGGSGSNFNNLIPAPNSVNTGPFLRFEQSVSKLVAGKTGSYQNQVWANVDVAGGLVSPTAISGKTGVYLWAGKTKGWIKDNKPATTVTAGIPVPPKKGEAKKFLINYMGKTEMQKSPFGLSASLAKLVYENRPYTEPAQILSKLTPKVANPTDIALIISKGPVYGRS